MTYTVTICWTGKDEEVHTGLSHMQAMALAGYTMKTFRVPVHIAREV